MPAKNRGIKSALLSLVVILAAAPLALFVSCPAPVTSGPDDPANPGDPNNPDNPNPPDGNQNTMKISVSLPGTDYSRNIELLPGEEKYAYVMNLEFDRELMDRTSQIVFSIDDATYAILNTGNYLYTYVVKGELDKISNNDFTALQDKYRAYFNTEKSLWAVINIGGDIEAVESYAVDPPDSLTFAGYDWTCAYDLDTETVTLTTDNFEGFDLPDPAVAPPPDLEGFYGKAVILKPTMKAGTTSMDAGAIAAVANVFRDCGATGVFFDTAAAGNNIAKYTLEGADILGVAAAYDGNNADQSNDMEIATGLHLVAVPRGDGYKPVYVWADAGKTLEVSGTFNNDMGVVYGAGFQGTNVTAKEGWDNIAINAFKKNGYTQVWDMGLFKEMFTKSIPDGATPGLDMMVNAGHDAPYNLYGDITSIVGRYVADNPSRRSALKVGIGGQLQLDSGTDAPMYDAQGKPDEANYPAKLDARVLEYLALDSVSYGGSEISLVDRIMLTGSLAVSVPFDINNPYGDEVKPWRIYQIKRMVSTADLSSADLSGTGIEKGHFVGEAPSVIGGGGVIKLDKWGTNGTHISCAPEIIDISGIKKGKLNAENFSTSDYYFPTIVSSKAILMNRENYALNGANVIPDAAGNYKYVGTDVGFPEQVRDSDNINWLKIYDYTGIADAFATEDLSTLLVNKADLPAIKKWTVEAFADFDDSNNWQAAAPRPKGAFSPLESFMVQLARFDVLEEKKRGSLIASRSPAGT
jgi:hypothetical protein